MKDFCDKLDKIVGYICALIILALTAETIYVIIMRYVFNAAPSWGEVISRFLMVYACMLGYSIAIHDQKLVRIDAFDRFLPPRLLNILEWFYTLCLLLFSVFMITEGIRFTILCSRNTLSGLNIPSSFEMVCIPMGGVFCLLQSIRRILNRRKS